MQHALITGTTSGIGKALAEKFLSEGWRVTGTRLAGDPQVAHPNFSDIELDLRSPESIAHCAHIAASGAPLDVAIHCAGVLLDEEETVLKPDLLRRTLEVNLIGTADLAEQLLPLLAPSGHVVFVSSTAGSMALTLSGESHYPGHYPAYKISKAGLNMYATTLAERLGDSGPAVSLVHPGWVRTKIGGEDADLSPEEAAAGIFLHAVSRPAERGGLWFRGERLPW